MRAIHQHEFGAPDVLRLAELTDPAPEAGEVLIRVRAAGVHLIDTAIRAGTTGGSFPLPELPMVPGREVAGIVEQVGWGVDECWIGRRVVTHLGMASGGYAELATRDVESIHEIPDGVTDDEAVAMIGTGRTTLAILDCAAPGPLDLVLVPAAAGGIGALLVQAALAADALVIALAGGPAKVAAARALGAHLAIDYTKPGWQDRLHAQLDGRQPTLAYDTVGGEIGRQLLELLRPGGRFVIAGWSAGNPTSVTTADLLSRSLTVTAALGPRVTARPGGLRDLEAAALQAVAERRLVPLVNEPIPLADAARAHADLVARRTTGKVVLRP
ncbi:MAG: zinc-binding dehydrogenase [Solirubrobacteraceae bacterium]|nr:zinc-binding dehydrogenase [Solirubrobacteraceae bacterium]